MAMFFTPHSGDQSGWRPHPSHVRKLPHASLCCCIPLHSSPGFHTDNITINLQKTFNLTMHQATISRVTNQRRISLAMSNFPDPPNSHWANVFIALQLTFKLISWSMSTIFQLHDNNNVPFLFLHR